MKWRKIINYDENHGIFGKKIKLKILVLGNFLFILFVYFYFDTTVTYLFNSHTLFHMHDRCIVIISKVHYESI